MRSMKKSIKRNITILLLAFFVCFGIAKVSVQVAGIQPYWDNADTVTVNLTVSGSTARSSLTVKGKAGTSKITGTLKLVDNTAGTNVGVWAISVNGANCSETKSSSVTAGHKFTLSFSGYVYDANGRGEYVSASDSK
ncbi:MAG: hypothetical protein HFI11_05605 [Lachnospiraceae bacterium]|nr:hypothetical protein [Lachnospiraceae bacterium]